MRLLRNQLIRFMRRDLDRDVIARMLGSATWQYLEQLQGYERLGSEHPYRDGVVATETWFVLSHLLDLAQTLEAGPLRTQSPCPDVADQLRRHQALLAVSRRIVYWHDSVDADAVAILADGLILYGELTASLRHLATGLRQLGTDPDCTDPGTAVRRLLPAHEAPGGTWIGLAEAQISAHIEFIDTLQHHYRSAMGDALADYGWHLYRHRSTGKMYLRLKA